MKKLIMICILLSVPIMMNAQNNGTKNCIEITKEIFAVTDDGRYVLLLPDGTWKFIQEAPEDRLYKNKSIDGLLEEYKKAGFVGEGSCGMAFLIGAGKFCSYEGDDFSIVIYRYPNSRSPLEWSTAFEEKAFSKGPFLLAILKGDEKKLLAVFERYLQE